ncbi:helix-turn-helix domain-containing protein [Pelagicoccus sp. SDUM812005]|uniref:helix-turn-helix domain-containing protein n=1 Tax=Pelagicoccus sp. SDUM812005 TaxID=3041257 RepID=UPI00281096B8|nr:helix-turn-helix domain-containing protein [Pelagicoccus sp. SDUM812005]MDQ8179346.1 helix-turn-helix domain-containing protein [Pelagicoccus sp. SDUM812005]
MDTFDPNRPDFQPYGLSCVSWNPSPMGRPDHHNEIELNHMVRGSVTYLLGGRKITLNAGQLGAFWASIPHQVISFSEDSQYFVVTIPFPWFLQFKLPNAFVHNLLHGELLRQRLGGRIESENDRFAQWEHDLGKGDKESEQIVLLELEARLRRMAQLHDELPTTSKSSTASKANALLDGSLNKVEHMACLVAQRYLEPLNAESIGKAVDLHPNYAMNLFKKTFGTTLVDYITHHRVSHAQRLLITTDDKILDVAMASGFNTLSRFNEAFRRACGCSPKEYRKRQR